MQAHMDAQQLEQSEGRSNDVMLDRRLMRALFVAVAQGRDMHLEGRVHAGGVRPDFKVSLDGDAGCVCISSHGIAFRARIYGLNASHRVHLAIEGDPLACTVVHSAGGRVRVDVPALDWFWLQLRVPREQSA